MNDKTLTEIFSEIGHFGTDIGCNDKNSTHTYTKVYDELFATFRNKCDFMEIGLALGDSIKLFDMYFTHSSIFGVDISVVFPWRDWVCNNSVNIIEADATKESFLGLLGNQMFDIIIDDGSHMEADQIATFKLLSPRMKNGGVYVIEDILALDQNRHIFQSLHNNCEVIDMRKENGRFDNVLIVYRF